MFRAISKQTRYQFFYSQSEIKNVKPITVHVKDIDVEGLLKLCFNEQPFEFKIINRAIIIRSLNKTFGRCLDTLSVNNGIEVSGRVLNEKGNPVEGVIVSVKGRNSCRITGTKGEFSFKSIAKNAILIFDHVAMDPFQLKLNGNTSLTVNLRYKVQEIKHN